jgi:Curlin associated repeat
MPRKVRQSKAGCVIAAAAVAWLASAHLAAADGLPAGCTQAGAACGSGLMPGNISTIQQSGNANWASVEQQAILGGTYPNITSIDQKCDYDSAKVTQTGEHNQVKITQHGNHDTAIVSQNGINLNAQINQFGNYGTTVVNQYGGWSTAGTNQH